jgi:hypothetical protein
MNMIGDYEIYAVIMDKLVYSEKPRMTKECLLTLVAAYYPAPPIYPIRIVKHDRVNVVARMKTKSIQLRQRWTPGKCLVMLRQLITHNGRTCCAVLHHYTFLYTLLLNSLHPIVLLFFLRHPAGENLFQFRLLLFLVSHLDLLRKCAASGRIDAHFPGEVQYFAALLGHG